MTDILDHGYVKLLDSMGDDLAIVNAARTSFDGEAFLHMQSCPLVSNGKQKSHEWDECRCQEWHDDSHPYRDDPRANLSKQDAGLINFLMRERHGTPFEMIQFKFAVKAPIFVFREWHRHRIASINEMSGRYVELPREFYVPARDDIREQKGKPGAYYYERMKDDGTARAVQDELKYHCNEAFNTYEHFLNIGIAKEVARLVLPVNTYSKMVWSVNLRSLMNFLSLRNHEHAQREIRYYAEAMEQMAFDVAPVAMQRFVDNGRKAP